MASVSNLNRFIRNTEPPSQPAPPAGRSTTDKTADSQFKNASETLLAKHLAGHSAQRSGADAFSTLISGFQSEAESDPAALRSALQQAFGDKASSAQLDQLAQQILTGNTPIPASFEIVDAESLGATNYGAYSAENGGTIYLDARLLDKPELMQSVFSEELGHHFDSVLGEIDAVGDEGAVFSQTLHSGPLEEIALNRLQSENDTGFIVKDGKHLAVEFRNGGDNHPSHPGNEGSSNTSNSGNNNSDNDEDRKPTTTTTQTPQTQDTADGPGGGDPDQFEQLTGISSNTTPSNPDNSDNDEDRKPESKPTSTPSSTTGIVIDPSVRDYDTADGPAGGDPDEFEKLTGVSSNWPDDNDEDKSGGGSADAVTVGGLGALYVIKRALSGVASGITAGSLAMGAAISATIGMALWPRPVGEGSDVVPTILIANARGPKLDPESEEVVNDAVGDTTREGVTSNGTIVDVVPDGDADQANEDFDEMGLDNVQTRPGTRGDIRTGTLPDGTKVTVRPSADGRPTIEITELDQNGDRVRGGVREIRYGNN